MHIQSFSNSQNHVANDFEMQDGHNTIHCFDTERFFVIKYLNFVIISNEL
jgi:hypothetical protein